MLAAMEFPAELPVITTPRVRLRPFTAADAPTVERLAGAREVADTTARIPHPYPEGAAAAWIATHAEAWATRRELALAITLAEGGELVGSIGLVFSPEHEKAELGYWIGLPFWGKGFASAAAGALVGFAFSRLGLNRVEAHHMARNPASGRVLLKAGLCREGVSLGAMRKNDRFEDVVFYGARRSDWRA
jgi:RimJ/RimL family protein N-acetyltransferase